MTEQQIAKEAALRVTENDFVRRLLKKDELSIVGKRIEVFARHTTIGNGSWGKIDFLVNHRGYTQIFVG